MIQRTGDKVRKRGAAFRLAASVAGVILIHTAPVARAQQPVATPPADSSPPAALAFQGVTVIDVATGQRVPGQTIVVVGNRIRAVGPANRIRLPVRARVRRADGTFAIPGLWDMHVHVMGFPNTFFPLFLANGVTGVRDMATPLPLLDSMLQWRREIAAGRRVGPRIVTAGPAISSSDYASAQEGLLQPGGKQGPGHMVSADTPEEGRRIVDSLKQRGVDFIKVYSYLERNVYFAILAEARRVGLPVAGHLPDSISVFEASDSGQRSIEHPQSLPLSTGCFAFDTQTVANVARCRVVAAYWRHNDTWFMPGPYIPTTGIGCGACQVPWYREQSRYWPDSLYDAWNRAPSQPHEPMPFTRSLEQWAALYTGPQDFRVARQAGIRFIAGTDVAPISFVGLLRPGFALHDLLWDLTRDGLTPLEALQSATLNPAKYFQATDLMGTIAPGKVADLVFLDADPLVDIFNTRRIRAVVADGRFYDRPALDSLLLGVERLAQQSRRP